MFLGISFSEFFSSSRDFGYFIGTIFLLSTGKYHLLSYLFSKTESKNSYPACYNSSISKSNDNDKSPENNSVVDFM